MARVIIRTNQDEPVAEVVVTNAEGPWTDAGTVIDEIAAAVNEALRREGDQA